MNVLNPLSKDKIWLKIRTQNLFLILINIIILGCTTPLKPIGNSFVGIDQINYKNYEIGKKFSVSIGEPIIKAKKYTITRLMPLYMRALSDFNVKGPALSISGDNKTVFNVKGEITTKEGEKYTVFELNGSYFRNGILYEKNHFFNLLVNTDGTLSKNKLYEGSRVKPYTFTTTPTDLKFIPVERYLIDKEKTYLNFDLIYGGISDNHIILAYREFSKKDLSTPAYFQILSYESNSKSIRFRNYEILIHFATNEEIEFTIIDENNNKQLSPSY